MIIFTHCNSGNKDHNSWEKKPNRQALSLLPFTALRELPVHMSGKGHPDGATQAPWAEVVQGSSWPLDRAPVRTELYREGTRGLQAYTEGSPKVFSWVLIRAFEWGNCWRFRGKKVPKRTTGNMAVTQEGSWIVTISTSQIRKLQDYTLRRVLRGFCLSNTV